MGNVKRYRKKPVVIEAVQYRHRVDGIGTKMLDIIRWIRKNGGEASGAGYEIHIDTLEGTMKAQIGDYIVKGIKGEFYPCKPDIFEATYEPVSPPPQSEAGL